MRKFTLRSLLILGGAFALLTAFTPRANADLLRFYDFDGTATPPYPVNLFSNAPALETGAGTELTLSDGAGLMYPPTSTSAAPGLDGLNLPGGAQPNVFSLGIDHSHEHNLAIDIPFFSATGIYDVTSVSFAYGANGNGYSAVQLFVSTNGGTTFTANGAPVPLPATPGAIVNLTVTTPTLNSPMVIVRLLFTGGQSNGNDLQNEIDNIQVGDTAVPEPATVAGGLLGVLGLCWFQRRRLIRSVRFRRT